MESPFPPECDRRFKPLRSLASGGFGTVWLAQQRTLGREVAIKLQRAETLHDQDQIARFLDEAKIAASLSHVNIVKVIDCGFERDPDTRVGVPWIAYEYVRGHSLARRLEAGPLPRSEAVSVAIQVARALEHSHERGVLHRDVKAENVLEAADGLYKLGDFGAAKWLHSGSARTAAGIVIGTPTHLAPETLRGEPPTASADLYALGILIHQMLTGRLPFESPDLADLLRQHLEEVPPRPSARRTGVPPALDSITMRALAKSPSDRYRTASELIADLTGIPDETIRPIDRTEALSAEVGGRPVPSTRVVRAPSRGSGERASVCVPDNADRSTEWVTSLRRALWVVVLGSVLAFAALRPRVGPAPILALSARSASTVPASLSPAVDPGEYRRDLERLSDLERKFDATYVPLDPTLATLSPDDSFPGNPLRLRPIVQEMARVLRQLITRGHEDRLTGSLWLEIEHAAEQFIGCLDRLDPHRLHANSTSLARSLRDLVGRAVDPVVAQDDAYGYVLMVIEFRLPLTRTTLLSAENFRARADAGLDMCDRLGRSALLARSPRMVVEVRLKLLCDAIRDYSRMAASEVALGKGRSSVPDRMSEVRVRMADVSEEYLRLFSDGGRAAPSLRLLAPVLLDSCDQIVSGGGDAEKVERARRRAVDALNLAGAQVIDESTRPLLAEALDRLRKLRPEVEALPVFSSLRSKVAAPVVPATSRAGAPGRPTGSVSR